MFPFITAVIRQEGQQPWSRPEGEAVPVGVRRSSDRLFWSQPEAQKPVGYWISFQEAHASKLGYGSKPSGVQPWLRPSGEARTIHCEAILRSPILVETGDPETRGLLGLLPGSCTLQNWERLTAFWCAATAESRGEAHTIRYEAIL